MLGLSEMAHRPRCILDAVKKFTSTPDNVQLAARDRFVSLRKAWGFRFTGGSDDQELHDVVRDAAVALDTYFFARSLTFIPPGADSAALEAIHVDRNIFEVGHIGHHVVTPEDGHIYGMTDGYGQTTIYIDAMHKGGPLAIKSIFETLVHEMAHAIYNCFACECESCDQEDPRVLGPGGHGRLWVKLMEHMRDTIRSWFNDLPPGDFLAEDLERIHLSDTEDAAELSQGSEGMGDGPRNRE